MAYNVLLIDPVKVGQVQISRMVVDGYEAFKEAWSGINRLAVLESLQVLPLGSVGQEPAIKVAFDDPEGLPLFEVGLAQMAPEALPDFSIKSKSVRTNTDSILIRSVTNVQDEALFNYNLIDNRGAISGDFQFLPDTRLQFTRGVHEYLANTQVRIWESAVTLNASVLSLVDESTLMIADNSSIAMSGGIWEVRSSDDPFPIFKVDASDARRTIFRHNVEFDNVSLIVPSRFIQGTLVFNGLNSLLEFREGASLNLYGAPIYFREAPGRINFVYTDSIIEFAGAGSSINFIGVRSHVDFVGADSSINFRNMGTINFDQVGAIDFRNSGSINFRAGVGSINFMVASTINFQDVGLINFAVDRDAVLNFAGTSSINIGGERSSINFVGYAPTILFAVPTARIKFEGNNPEIETFSGLEFGGRYSQIVFKNDKSWITFEGESSGLNFLGPRERITFSELYAGANIQFEGDASYITFTAAGGYEDEGSYISFSAAYSYVKLLGNSSYINLAGLNSYIRLEGESSYINLAGLNSYIRLEGESSYINLAGLNSYISFSAMPADSQSLFFLGVSNRTTDPVFVLKKRRRGSLDPWPARFCLDDIDLDVSAASRIFWEIRYPGLEFIRGEILEITTGTTFEMARLRASRCMCKIVRGDEAIMAHLQLPRHLHADDLFNGCYTIKFILVDSPYLAEGAENLRPRVDKVCGLAVFIENNQAFGGDTPYTVVVIDEVASYLEFQATISLAGTLRWDLIGFSMDAELAL